MSEKRTLERRKRAEGEGILTLREGGEGMLVLGREKEEEEREGGWREKTCHVQILKKKSHIFDPNSLCNRLIIQ